MRSLRTLLLVSLCACQSPSDSGPPAPEQVGPPNIVFLFTDDHSTAAVSAYGSRINHTPHLDRLAAEGATFTGAFVTNSICSPSRAVVLTGKHSHLNGVPNNGAVFDGSQTTFPALLQGAGYQTAMIGKWHLRSDPTGFDHWEVLPGQGHYYSPVFRTAEGKRQYPGYVTDVVTDLALDWLDERDPTKPFLLMAQHKAPHRSWMPGPDHLDLYEGEVIPEPATLFDDYATRGSAAREQEMSIAHHMYLEYDLKVPLEPDEEAKGPDRWASGAMDRLSEEERANWDAAFGPRNAAFRAMDLSGDALVRWKYQRYIKNYLRCIASVDDNVGRILDYLDEQGLADNTIVVYASDQGFYLGEHGWYDKRFMYEPSLRFPLIVRWPGRTPKGSRPSQLVQNLDLAPTFLEAAGLGVPAEMQGVSLVPLLSGREPDDWRTSIYYEYSEVGIHNVAAHYGVRTEQHKLIHFPATNERELYDLASDPDELRNLADQAEHAALQAELQAELDRLRDVYQVP